MLVLWRVCAGHEGEGVKRKRESSGVERDGESLPAQKVARCSPSAAAQEPLATHGPTQVGSVQPPRACAVIGQSETAATDDKDTPNVSQEGGEIDADDHSAAAAMQQPVKGPTCAAAAA